MITKEFIHLHLPRTAGTAFRHVISNKFADKVTIISDMNHPTPKAIEELNATAPKFILVRNPWSWYVSWYRWRIQRHNFTGTFQEHMNQMLHTKNNGLYVPFSQVGTLTDCFNGFTQAGVDDIYKFEDVPLVYAKAVAKYSNIDPILLLDELNKCKLRSSEETRHYSYYYTEETMSMVSEIDSTYICRFGYEFEGEML